LEWRNRQYKNAILNLLLLTAFLATSYADSLFEGFMAVTCEKRTNARNDEDGTEIAYLFENAGKPH